MFVLGAEIPLTQLAGIFAASTAAGEHLTKRQKWFVIDPFETKGNCFE